MHAFLLGINLGVGLLDHRAGRVLTKMLVQIQTAYGMAPQGYVAHSIFFPACIWQMLRDNHAKH